MYSDETNVIRGREIPPRLRTGAVATAALAVLALAATCALADKVTTKTGDVFTGTVVEEDTTKVVLKTLSGTMTLPRETVKSVEKSGAAAPSPSGDVKAPAAAQIVAVPVEPANAAKALQDAKSALVAGAWIKAGGILEGLMALDEKAFAGDDRMAATGALVNCYLQIKDAQGAARALTRRAQLAADANDKRRLLGAAEALRTSASTQFGDKVVTRFEEAVEAGMAWKTEQCLATAKDLAAKFQRHNEMVQLEKNAKTALGKLEEADVFVPGYSAGHRKEVLAVFVNKILEAAKSGCDLCEKVRPELTQTRFTSVASRALAQAWNDKAVVYLNTRQMAEDAVKNLKPFTTKMEVPELYTQNAAAVAKFLKDLDDYQYYPEGTPLYPPSYYGYYGYSSSSAATQRIKIQLRTILR